MPHAIVVGGVGAEETLGAAVKAGAAAVDEGRIGACREGLQIVSAAQDGLHRAVMWRVVRKRPLTGSLQAHPAVGISQIQYPLSSSEPLEDPIPEQVLDERAAVGTYGAGLLQTPGAIAAEELPSIRGQMIQHGASIAVTAAAQMHRHLPIVLVERYRNIRGSQPQGLSDQREGGGVERVVELHMTVAMQLHAMPAP